METPVLILGRGGDDKLGLPLGGVMGSGSVSCCCFSARTAAYSATLSGDISTTEESKNEKESTQTQGNNT